MFNHRERPRGEEKFTGRQEIINKLIAWFKEVEVDSALLDKNWADILAIADNKKRKQAKDSREELLDAGIDMIDSWTQNQEINPPKNFFPDTASKADIVSEAIKQMAEKKG